MLFSVTFLLLQLVWVYTCTCVIEFVLLATTITNAIYYMYAQKRCLIQCVVYCPTDDLVNSTARTVILGPVNRFFFPRLPELIVFSTVRDNLNEGEECLVFTLSINETQLDPRDQGQVDFSSSVALVRINDLSIGECLVACVKLCTYLRNYCNHWIVACVKLCTYLRNYCNHWIVCLMHVCAP